MNMRRSKKKTMFQFLRAEPNSSMLPSYIHLPATIYTSIPLSMSGASRYNNLEGIIYIYIYNKPVLTPYASYRAEYRSGWTRQAVSSNGSLMTGGIIYILLN
jgi:hypothetical protein